MKLIDVSTKKYPEKFVKVDDEDYEELNNMRWHYNTGYAARRFYKNDGTSDYIGMHRYIMKPSKDKLVDHINMDPLDNRKENLRVCGKKENSMNGKLRTDNSSGYKGVHKTSKKSKTGYEWRVNLKKNGKQFFAGYFNDVKEAANCYNRHALEMYGEYARLNVIED